MGKRPEFSSYGAPEWFHHHGRKMNLENLDLEQKILVIKGSAATIEISARTKFDKSGWRVHWEIKQSPVEQSRGSVWMDDEHLKMAFGLSEESGKYGDWLIGRFGGESAEQGQFIRFENFLNIPCPGTGHDGDPNISIVLDDKIRDAVEHLLACA